MMTRRFSCTVLALLAGLVLFAPVARAQTPPAKLTIGLFAPNSGFTGGNDFGYIQSLAKHLTNVTGIPTTGQVWRDAGSFSRAAGGLNFAVVDPIYLCFNKRFTVLASGRLGGGGRAPWGLYGSSGFGRLGDLKGKRLALAASGAGDTSFAEGMLGGRLKVTSFFSQIVYRKDLTSAINAVKGGQADAVLAPAALATGLRLIFATPSVPNAGFVVAGGGLPQDLIRKVAGAVMGFGGPAVGGWGGPTAYSCPAGRVSYAMETVNLRYVPPAGESIIRKLPAGKGYSMAPILGHFRVD
jgi:ABC-type phosphate/phosphonate transport system substrate-binding protein